MLTYGDIPRLAKDWMGELARAKTRADYERLAERLPQVLMDKRVEKMWSEFVASEWGEWGNAKRGAALFLAYLKIQLLQTELAAYQKRFDPPRTAKEIEAENEDDPRRQRILFELAEKERAKLYPEAYAAEKARVPEIMDVLNGLPPGFGRRRKGARGAQDAMPARARLSRWSVTDLAMDIYDLRNATKVRRATLLNFFKKRKIAATRNGRRAIYSENAVRLVVREWLTNPYWHERNPRLQRKYLLHYLDGTAHARPNNFSSELERLAQAIEQVRRIDPSIDRWIDETKADAVKLSSVSSSSALNILLGLSPQ
jgi:hypothetical protein